MKTLKINGKEYPFKLELGAVRLYAIKQGIKKVKSKDIMTLMTEADIIADYPVLIWAGLKTGASRDNKFTETPETVRKWLDDEPQAFDDAVEMIQDDNEVPEFEGKETAEAESPSK